MHVHLKVHLGGVDSFTGQLFFDEALTDEVDEASPYDRRPGRDTLNTTDGIFRGGGDETLVAPAREGDGYRGSVTLGVRRT